MSIRAVFPLGWSKITVHGLHQWDYGQTLEIQADDLPAIVEVHFACQGMKDAPVRVCNAVLGVATAAIPDICLEQNTTVTAWIYEVGETSGRTIKTVSLPIIARARPQSVETVPAEGFSDQYTEALAALNAAVENVKTGNVLVAKALKATEADFADHADRADRADRATEANHADRADALNISQGYTKYTAGSVLRGGLIAFEVHCDNHIASVVMDLASRYVFSSILLFGTKHGVVCAHDQYGLGEYKIYVRDGNLSEMELTGSCEIYYKRLSAEYAVG